MKRDPESRVTPSVKVRQLCGCLVPWYLSTNAAIQERQVVSLESKKCPHCRDGEPSPYRTKQARRKKGSSSV